jgi:hypothetical protein
MKRCILIAILSVFAASATADELLAKPELAELARASMPDGVTIVLEEVGGVPALRITNTNVEPMSVILGEVPLENVSDTRIEYEALMAASDTDGTAYLELWVVSGGKPYFSRALNDVFSGTQAERKTATPFFLKAGESMEAARLGVRFESPGTVTLRELALWDRDPMGFAMNSGMIAGVAGSIFGVGSALFFCVAVLLALKGIGRGGVLGVTLGLCVASVAAFATGLLLWSQGSAWSLWYPVVLLGGIGLVNFGVGYMVLRWWYGKTEARRMAAMDMQ